MKMARKEFPNSIVEAVLVKCRRHCCVCGIWCGTKIEVHHIDDPEDNSEDNALPVCFNCHAEVKHYNSKHPKGRKFPTTELKKLRDATFTQYSAKMPSVPAGGTDYGHGFHDGVSWTEKNLLLKQIWSLLSMHGDFALEILIKFGQENTHPMTDESFWDDAVDSGSNISQFDGSMDAWRSGCILGFWDLNGNTESLYLTKNGIFCRQYVMSTMELRQRFDQLAEFWDNHEYGTTETKPETKKRAEPAEFKAGVLNWLQIEIYRLLRLNDVKTKLFIISNVTPNELELTDIENGERTTLNNEEIDDVIIDEDTGELLLYCKTTSI